MYYSNLYLFIPGEQFPNCVREAVFALKSARISTISTHPTFSYRKRRLQPLPQTPFPLQERGLKRKSQKPPIFFRFWYRGTRDGCLCCRDRQ